MTTPGADEIRALLVAGRREEARRQLREAGPGEAALDLPALCAERIGVVPRSADRADDGEVGDDAVLVAWRVPEELGGGAVLADLGWGAGATLVDPDDLLILGFGGIGAAVGSVPIQVHRRTAGGETERVALWTVEVGPGSAGAPLPGPTPEELHDQAKELLRQVEAETGIRWIPEGDLPKEEWDRAAFLEHYRALAGTWGLEPMDGTDVDRENCWIRYVSSPVHDTVEGFARAVARATAAPRFDEATLEAAADALGRAVEEEAGIRLSGLEIVVDGPLLRARIGEATLAEEPGTRREWERLLSDAERPAEEVIAGALVRALPDDLRERLVEIERRRLEATLAPVAEERLRAALSHVVPEAELAAEVRQRSIFEMHGDPEGAGERGLPPFCLVVRSWDPDARATVPSEGVPPDPERLAREATNRLRETLQAAATFPSPEASVPAIDALLAGEAWGILALHYDLEGSGRTLADVARWEWFAHGGRPVADPRGGVDKAIPFPPAATYADHEEEGDLARVTVAVDPELHGASKGSGERTFFLIRSGEGWKLLAPDDDRIEARGDAGEEP